MVKKLVVTVCRFITQFTTQSGCRSRSRSRKSQQFVSQSLPTKQNLLKISNTTNVDNSSHSALRSIFMDQIGPDIFGALSRTQIRFIDYLCNIHPSIGGDSLREITAETFPTAKQFNQKCLDLLPRNIKLRKIWDDLEFALPQHTSRSIIHTLVCGLYSDSEDWESAIQNASLVISHGSRVQMNSSFKALELSQFRPQRSGSSTIPPKRIAQNLAMRVKD